MFMQGVMISHSAVVAEVAGLHAFLKQISYGNSITERDVVLSYLPLAHIFDRCLSPPAIPSFCGHHLAADQQIVLLMHAAASAPILFTSVACSALCISACPSFLHEFGNLFKKHFTSG